MAQTIRFEGDPAAQFARLARDLKKAGEVDLRKELYSGIQRGARPLIQAAKDSAASTLPHSGGRGVRGYSKATGHAFPKLRTKGRVHIGAGSYTRVESLAARVVNAKYRVTSRAGRNPAITLRAKDSTGRAVNLNALDHGRDRHPVFGNRKVWVDQTVPEGWWSKPMEEGIPAVSLEVRAAVTRVVEKFYT
jgi:hypothetical protein